MLAQSNPQKEEVIKRDESFWVFLGVVQKDGEAENALILILKPEEVVVRDLRA